MKTHRLVFVFILVCSCLFGSLLFVVSQKVQSVERDIRTVDKIVDNEKEAIRVLNAEWHYLNRPDRLEKVLSETKKDFQMMEIINVDRVLQSEVDEEIRSLPRPVSKPLFVKHKQVDRKVGVSKKVFNGKLEEKNFQELLNGLEAANGE